MSNTFGQMFRFTTFGESHGEAMGVVVDGCPAGVVLSVDDVQKELHRRRPGQVDTATQTVLVSSRNESDQVEIL